MQFPVMPLHPQSLSEIDLRMINIEGMMTLLRKGIFIKQKMCILEAVTGIDTPNRYFVYELSNTGQGKGRKLFKCIEKSSCISRCLAAGCKPFDMEIRKVEFNESEDDIGDVVLIL